MLYILTEFVNAMTHGREQIAVSTRVNAPQHVIDVLDRETQTASSAFLLHLRTNKVHAYAILTGRVLTVIFLAKSLVPIHVRAA